MSEAARKQAIKRAKHRDRNHQAAAERLLRLQSVISISAAANFQT